MDAGKRGFRTVDLTFPKAAEKIELIQNMATWLRNHGMDTIVAVKTGKAAQKYSISCTLLCDTNHVLNSDYSEIIIVGAAQTQSILN